MSGGVLEVSGVSGNDGNLDKLAEGMLIPDISKVVWTMARLIVYV